MSEQEHRPPAALTDEQRRLVRENVGLVAVHLRRNVVHLIRGQGQREWEDLFQEGCLGLIRAATDYRPERRIPFAAFALPRIHNAVSRALQTKFSTIYTPPRRRARGDGASGAVPRDDEGREPKAFAWSSDLTDRVAVCPESPSPYDIPRRGRAVLASSRSHCKPPDAGRTSRQTIGQRLREKYERAVRAAAEAASDRPSTRGDREGLVRALVEERYLVPDEESRHPFRRIARETRSSYGRVADCDRQLTDDIRRTLEADPEFRALQRLSKTDPNGVELPIDDGLEHELAALSAVEFTRRFQNAERDERTRMLQDLLELLPGDLDEIIRTRVATLPTDARERLLRGR